jgi:XTP/dITP diphosphohydrolase
MRLCFATNNEHKLSEVRQMLGQSFELLSLKEISCHQELSEDFATLEENSLQKAQYVFDKYKIGCFADDTGLEVEALDGAPGVYSARYAGPQRSSQDNIQKLLGELKTHPNRRAQFRTVITLIGPHERKQFEGIVTGKIIDEIRGEEGFGYDPVFVPEGHHFTLAEMPPYEKNLVSHRANAIKKLVAYLTGQSHI